MGEVACKEINSVRLTTKRNHDRLNRLSEIPSAHGETPNFSNTIGSTPSSHDPTFAEECSARSKSDFCPPHYSSRAPPICRYFLVRFSADNPVVVVSPDLPPKRGGVADHTWRLLEILSPHADLGVLSSPSTLAPGSVRRLPPVVDWQDGEALNSILDQIPTSTILLWQYVPHMYGRGGVNAAVPRAACHWKSRGGRQVFLVHELYAPWSLLPNRWWYARQQRRQWKIIRDTADAVGMSTESWLLSEKPPSPVRSQFFFCPSPSNISIAPVPPGHARSWRRVAGWPEDSKVVGVFGSLGPPSRWRFVEHACANALAEGIDVRLVSFGQTEFRGGSIDSDRQRILGFIDEREVSEALQACDVLALPYIDGISERRGSAMAGFAHGCCVATTIGSSTGPGIRQGEFFANSPARDSDAFSSMVGRLLLDAPKRKNLGESARSWYQAHYDWPVVGETLLAHIRRLGSGSGSNP